MGTFPEFKEGVSVQICTRDCTDMYKRVSWELKIPIYLIQGKIGLTDDGAYRYQAENVLLISYP
jgi:hypothetical protein